MNIIVNNFKMPIINYTNSKLMSNLNIKYTYFLVFPQSNLTDDINRKHVKSNIVS